MDNRKVFLEENRSVGSTNQNSFVGIDLSAKSRLLPYNNISDILDLNDLYNSEKNACNQYRVILTINPICSNVLFNSKTEIVRYEGSDNAKLLVGDNTGDRGLSVNTTTLNNIQGIRDTEYTHPSLFEDNEPYVYHCGFDIFNNHLLRANDFVYVNKVGTGRTNDYKVFNTIKDYVRDKDGNPTMETISQVNNEKTMVHLYNYDTIMTMYEAYTERLVETDGWYGFNNRTMISIPNTDYGVTINKVMNNNKSCEMIDLYPDRSLYSFVPKVNKYRHRIEKNWDYCITYPFAKDSEKLNEVCSSTAFTVTNASIAICEAKRQYSPTGNPLVQFKTKLKHNLKKGDYVRLYYVNGNELTRFEKRVRVLGIGDIDGNNPEKYFIIDYDDINLYFGINERGIITFEGQEAIFYYKKDVDGVECSYYFRKFKKLKNNDDELTSVINKLAYGENIYGDRVAQIVFTDNIDVTGLFDHNGRPLSELYFTVIKRNAGHELWYDNNNTTDATIEFSHCFSDVTSGLDLSEDINDYNVRKLHNIDVEKLNDIGKYSAGTFEVFGNLKKILPLESGLTIDNDEFYGDIVEFDPINVTETVIEKVYHRFNTAQRETLNNKYFDIIEDTLLYDDYDVGVTKYPEPNNNKIVSAFTVSSAYTNTYGDKLFAGNLNPEGYFYDPFTKMTIREEQQTTSNVIGTTLRYDSDSFVNNGTVTYLNEDGEEVLYHKFSLTLPMAYNLYKGDVVGIYDTVTDENKWMTINNIVDNTVEFISEDEYVASDFSEDRLKTIVFVGSGVPAYARYIPKTHSYVWRGLVLPSELPNDSMLFNRPFANGCFYIEQNVNFFLKRQDPTGDFGLLETDKTTKLSSYKLYGWGHVDFENIRYNNGLLTDICY